MKKLSLREVQVLQQLSEGKSSKAIGKELGISSKTIENYKQNIRNKLGISNTVGLIKYAIRSGIVEL